ncbi:MAG: hypothetical protein MJE68_21240 [Proteobacteria bacterium]|nr:hypothetical protein [Pseudomonadota bacterium]
MVFAEEEVVGAVGEEKMVAVAVVGTVGGKKAMISDEKGVVGTVDENVVNLAEE